MALLVLVPLKNRHVLNVPRHRQSALETKYVGNFLSSVRRLIKGTGGSADLKINKSDPLSFNHHTFSNTEPIYIK